MFLTQTFAKKLSQNQPDSEQDLNETFTTQNSCSNPLTESQGFMNNDFEEFSETFYDNIEEFLDNEGLHITSDCTFSSLTQTVLKPFSNMKKIKSLTVSPIQPKLRASDDDDNEGFDLSAIPSFLAKRTFSAGLRIYADDF